MACWCLLDLASALLNARPNGANRAGHPGLWRALAAARRARTGRRLVFHEEGTAVAHIVAGGRLARDLGHNLGAQARPALVRECKGRLGLERIAWPSEPGDDGGCEFGCGADELA